MGEIIAKIAEALSHPGTIGLFVIAIILIPVFVVTAISILEPPRTLRIPGLFLGSLILLTVIIIAAFAALSSLLGFVVN